MLIKNLLLTLIFSFLTLNTSYAQQLQTLEGSEQFFPQKIASESFESVGVFDVDGDGNLDIVSGSFWYEGPEFQNKNFIKNIERYGEYWDDFATIPFDINGDGSIDYVTGGWFSKELKWVENPGDGSEWQEHVIDHTGNIETIRSWDVDDDGFLEIVPNNPNDPLKFYKINRDNNGVANGTFKKVTVAEGQGHGLGFGDINGDGKGDFITSNGWYEGPEDIYNGNWEVHNEFDLEDASVPIIVVDVDDDGLNDLIVGQGHSYGLSWYKQEVSKDGERQWIKNSIDSENSQFHTMEWADIDGDGSNELITGKRFYAHNGDDPGANDPIGLYYYKFNRDQFLKNTISYGPLGKGKGAGIYFEIVDLEDNGLKDIIVAGKDGLYIFYNKGLKN